MKNFKIADRIVGPNHPPLVLAEVGINHEGEIEKAIQCVDAAVAAGAEVVKFQCHITEYEMLRTDMTPGDISSEKLWDIIERCELTEGEERHVQSYATEKGILYLSTPFSREAADRLLDMEVPAFKIGSGECNNLPLIDHIAQMGRPMIVSTGMNDLASVQRTVGVIRDRGTPYALMHCTSMYPTAHKDVRLGGVVQLSNEFPNVPIGLSDHSMGIWTCLGSVALGACILEKHFTVSRDWAGPDVPISIEPDELSDLVTGSRAIWEARGGAKTVLPGEKPVIDFAYATVVSIAPILAGEELTYANVWVKRPGTGPILANRLDEVLGCRAIRDIEAGNQIAPQDLEGFT